MLNVEIKTINIKDGVVEYRYNNKDYKFNVKSKLCYYNNKIVAIDISMIKFFEERFNSYKKYNNKLNEEVNINEQ